MDTNPTIDFVRFASIAEVWHMEDFWHVHLSMKQSVFDTGIFSNCMKISHANDLPIRFTSANNDVLWLKGGFKSNPFGPSRITHSGSKETRLEYNDYDPQSRLLFDHHRRDTGSHRLDWDPTGRIGKDAHTILQTASAGCKRVVWSTANTHLRGDMRAVWETIQPTFHDSHTVRYYPFRQRMWLVGGTRLERKSLNDPTCITDHDVFERGVVTPTGGLELTRVMLNRTYSWARQVKSEQMDDELWPTLVTNYHRGDGPALVNVYAVKDTVTNSGCRTQVTNDYHHEWYRNGKSMTGKQVQDWAKSHGVIMIDHPCHDRPCFPNEMDRTMWTLT